MDEVSRRLKGKMCQLHMVHIYSNEHNKTKYKGLHLMRPPQTKPAQHKGSHGTTLSSDSSTPAIPPYPSLDLRIT